MNYTCVIPARFASSRFPGKILAPIGGKPMVQRTWEAAARCALFQRIIIAVDTPHVADVVASFGGEWIMTPTTCMSGTERLSYLATTRHLDGDIIVNWQCDEPFITRNMIDDLLQSCTDRSVGIWSLKKKILDAHEVFARNVAKVVSDAHDNALYFSRSPIPLVRDATPDAPLGAVTYYKHIGLYAYTIDMLKRLATLSSCESEQAEQLEQLRFLHHGLTIRLHETGHSPIAIDTPHDLVRAENYWKATHENCH